MVSFRHCMPHKASCVALLFLIELISSASAASSPYFGHATTVPNVMMRRSRRQLEPRYSGPGDSYSAALLVARSNRKLVPSGSKPVKQAEQPDGEVDISDLNILGKTVFGVTAVVFATLFEYASGFVTGFLLGSIVGIPGFVFNPTESVAQKAFMKEMSSRFARMNTRSLTWARSWGGISAAFGGSKEAVYVLRGKRTDDAWDNILSSAIAGAWFARKEGPQAMLKGALLYGGLLYLLSGGMGSRGGMRYEEREIEYGK